MAKQHYTTLSPKDRERQLIAIKYMLQVLRLTQKDIAATLDISVHTVGRIIRRYNLAKQAQKAAINAINKPVRYDDSLTAFIVICRRNHKAVYPIIENIYKQHLNDLKKQF